MLAYLALGCALLAAVLWTYRRSPGVRRGRWRVGAGLLAAAMLGAGALVAVRGGYAKGSLLILAALGLAMIARTDRTRRPRRPPRGTALDEAQARAILEVGETADEAEIKAAYARLMRRAHPDRGGTAEAAARLNAARDRLLKK